jgi:TPR repeat protein
MKRTLLFLSSFIIVVAAAGAIYVGVTGNADALRAKLMPGANIAAQDSADAEPVSAEVLLDQATDYFLGTNGVTQDEAAGAALVRQAAESGNQRAIGLVGMLYLGGIGVEQDLDTARDWLLRSENADGQKLAELLIAFETIVEKLPPEEQEKQRAEAHGASQKQVRALFIAALNDLRTQRQAAMEGAIEAPTDEPDATPLIDAPAMPVPAGPAE